MIKVKKVPLPSLGEPLTGFIQGFVDHSKEKELTVEKVYDIMKNFSTEYPSGSNAFYWIVEDGKKKGYLYAVVIDDEYFERIVWVQSTFMDGVKGYVWGHIQNELKALGKSHRCKAMYFDTLRNPKAFARRLRQNWTLDSYSMKHTFEDKDYAKKSIR